MPRVEATKCQGRRAFTLTELLIGACLMVIVLGLAVSLSRQVRSESARALTNDLLARLERQASEYARLNGGAYPSVGELIPPRWVPSTQPSRGGEILGADGAPLSEVELRRRAVSNNRDFLLAVHKAGLSGAGGSGGVMGEEFKDLSVVVYDPQALSLRDAWGTPIVFVPGQHPLLGMAPRNACFFLSAGPDRKFLTREDNLYSYEAFRQR